MALQGIYLSLIHPTSHHTSLTPSCTCTTSPPTHFPHPSPYLLCTLTHTHLHLGAHMQLPCNSLNCTIPLMPFHAPSLPDSNVISHAPSLTYAMPPPHKSPYTPSIPSPGRDLFVGTLKTKVTADCGSVVVQPYGSTEAYEVLA